MGERERGRREEKGRLSGEAPGNGLRSVSSFVPRIRFIKPFLLSARVDSPPLFVRPRLFHS